MTPDEFGRRAPIHPDSLGDYRVWHERLNRWNARINLVAPKSLPDFWERHALDSAQLLPLITENDKIIVDFGSGAGFPALSIAIEAKHAKLDQTVHLIESAGKKASFLKTVSRETSLPATIHHDRIEAIASLQANVITARAFAPLHRLLPLAYHHLAKDGRLVLLKGEGLDQELGDVEANWAFDHKRTDSLSSETGSIVEIWNLRPK